MKVCYQKHSLLSKFCQLIARILSNKTKSELEMVQRTNDWIRQRREALKLSQDDLAARLQIAGLDVTRAAVSHWENGRYSSPLDTAIAIKALADALEVTIGELLAQIGYEANGELTSKERQVINALRRGDKIEAIRLISNE